MIVFFYFGNCPDLVRRHGSAKQAESEGHRFRFSLVFSTQRNSIFGGLFLLDVFFLANQHSTSLFRRSMFELTAETVVVVKVYAIYRAYLDSGSISYLGVSWCYLVRNIWVYVDTCWARRSLSDRRNRATSWSLGARGEKSRHQGRRQEHRACEQGIYQTMSCSHQPLETSRFSSKPLSSSGTDEAFSATEWGSEKSHFIWAYSSRTFDFQR